MASCCSGGPNLDLSLPVPSLALICMRNIAASLWFTEDMLIKLKAFTPYQPPSWENLRHDTRLKSNSLFMEASLRQELCDVIKILGSKIYYYIKKIHMFSLHAGISLEYLYESLGNLRFTVHGTVDMKSMACKMIRDERMDDIQRFKIACHYCLLSDIASLWPNLCPTWRDDLVGIRERETPLVIFWSHGLSNASSQTNHEGYSSYLALALAYAFQNRYEEALHFLWSILPNEEKFDNLTDLSELDVSEVNIFNVHFLLNRMNDDNELGCYVSGVHATRIFYSLLDWPALAKSLLPLTGKNRYLQILISAAKNWNHPLFKFVWNEAPETLRSSVTSNYKKLLAILVAFARNFNKPILSSDWCRDFNTVVYFARRLSNEDIEQLVLSKNGLFVFDSFVPGLKGPSSNTIRTLYSTYFSLVVRLNDEAFKRWLDGVYSRFSRTYHLDETEDKFKLNISIMRSKLREKFDRLTVPNVI